MLRVVNIAWKLTLLLAGSPKLAHHQNRYSDRTYVPDQFVECAPSSCNLPLRPPQNAPSLAAVTVERGLRRGPDLTPAQSPLLLRRSDRYWIPLLSDRGT